MEASASFTSTEEPVTIIMRQLGIVGPHGVRWIGGGRDHVALSGLANGQWIEAICERDSLTGRLIRVAHVKCIPSIRLMTRAEEDAYWDSLPVASLPESDIDWTSSVE